MQNVIAPMPISQLRRIIAKSPIPNLEDYAKDAIKRVANLHELGRAAISPQQLALAYARTYDISTPINFVNYSVLMHADPDIRISSRLEGVYQGRRFYGNWQVANIETTENTACEKH